MLDFQALEPGRAATEAIAAAAERLDLAGEDQARVRPTGVVPMNDAEFATLKQHALLNGVVSIAAVLIILWLALRSPRIILAAVISVACGLAYSAALGLFLVGALNLISVAFFVLFVGLGVDFGIQFSVRYRAERHDTGELRPALVSARNPRLARSSRPPPPSPDGRSRETGPARRYEPRPPLRRRGPESCAPGPG